MKKNYLKIITLGLALTVLLLPQNAGAAANVPTLDGHKSVTTKEADGHKGQVSQAPVKHQKFDKKEIRSLMEKGHSKKNVFQAAHIARLSEKPIEEVLNHYDKSKSWEKTAEHFGVNPEKLAEQRAKWQAHKKKYKEHKDEILNYIGEYSNQDVSELKGYMKKGVKMHHLVKAAVLAKLSDKDMKEVIQYKKAGHTREETLAHFNVTKEQMHAEMKKVWSEIKMIVEK